MCFVEGGQTKYQLRCMTIAIVSLIFHICLLCISIAALIVVNEKNASIRFDDLPPDTHIKMYFGDINKSTLAIVSGLLSALNVFGVIASVVLLIGSKYNKPGCVAVYLCYILQMSILLLISGILLLLKLQWPFASLFLSLFGITSGVTMTLSKYYDAMNQDMLRSQQDSISDITRLIEADSLDDTPPE